MLVLYDCAVWLQL